jgi:hypothetical protein
MSFRDQISLPPDGLRPAWVVAPQRTLKELAEGAELGAIAGLDPAAPKGPSDEIIGVPIETLTSDGSASSRERFSAMAHRLVAADKGKSTILLWRIKVPEDARGLLAWLSEFAHSAACCVQPDRRLGVDWSLVVVAEIKLDSEAVATLSQCLETALDKGSDGAPNADAILVRRCFLMTHELRTGPSDVVIAARDGWKPAVGRLLLHLHGMSGEVHRWQGFVAWTSGALRLDEAVESALDEEYRAIVKEALESPDPRFKETTWELPIPDSGKVPTDRVDADELAGRQSSAFSKREIQFTLSSSGMAPREAAERIQQWQKTWGDGIRTTDRIFLRKKEEESCKSAAGTRAKRRNTAEIAWERVQHARAHARTIVGGQWLQNQGPSLDRLLNGQDERWRRLLRHHSGLEVSLRNTQACAEELDAARKAYVGLGWRILSAVCVSTFVGIVASTSLRSIMGSESKAAVLAGVAAGAGTVLVTLGLHLLEGWAGDQAAKALEQEVRRRERDIEVGLHTRRRLVAEAYGVAGESSRQSMVGHMQAIARRLLDIERSAEQMPSMSSRASGTRFDAGAAKYVQASSHSIPAPSGAGGRIRARDEWKRKCEALAAKARQQWTDFAQQEDPTKLGSYRIGPTYLRLRAILEEIRSELRDEYARELLQSDHSQLPERLELYERILVPDKSDLPLLSVRTDLNRSGSAVTPDALVWTTSGFRALVEVHGSPFGCRDMRLLQGSSLIALCVRLCHVEFSSRDQSWREVPLAPEGIRE